MDESGKLARPAVTVDDGRDYTAQLVWLMGYRRDMRNGVSTPMPDAPRVAPVRVEAKKKPRKRDYKIVQIAIGAV